MARVRADCPGDRSNPAPDSYMHASTHGSFVHPQVRADFLIRSIWQSRRRSRSYERPHACWLSFQVQVQQLASYMASWGWLGRGDNDSETVTRVVNHSTARLVCNRKKSCSCLVLLWHESPPFESGLIVV